MKTKWKLADDGFCFINLVPFLEFHACRITTVKRC